MRLIITASCFRSDGFLQLMWMKKECSKARMLLVWLRNHLLSTVLRENYSVSPGKNKGKKNNFLFCFVFCWMLIFQRAFLLCLSSLYASAFVFCWMSCLISVKAKRKKRRGLLSVSLRVLCRDDTELRTRLKLTADSFTLEKTNKGSSFLQVKLYI